MSDIFVSYAREDGERVKPLVSGLEACGWTMWWDRTIAGGQVWEREIENALASSSCVIVLWTRASVNSDWVRAEASEGKNRNALDLLKAVNEGKYDFDDDYLNKRVELVRAASHP